jgi:hypothetical protein
MTPLYRYFGLNVGFYGEVVVIAREGENHIVRTLAGAHVATWYPGTFAAMVRSRAVVAL